MGEQIGFGWLEQEAYSSCWQKTLEYGNGLMYMAALHTLWLSQCSLLLNPVLRMSGVH